MSPLDATAGQRYQILCRRHGTKHQPTYTGTYLGTDSEWFLFELEDAVRLRVDDWALVGLEPA